MNFDRFPLDPRVRAGVDAAGYTTPTPIQAKALTDALAGRDVLGLAQTGTGKTAAFALPLLDRLVHGPRGHVRALVVAPTRELAEQIHDEIKKLGARTNLRSATVYGGVSKGPQERALKGRAEIIVACPGRLLDHLTSGVGSLARVEVLVLDEADHMFDMGFLPDLRRIVKAVPKEAQRLLFSATMPKEVRHLVEDMLSDPLRVEIAHSAPASTIEHALYPVHADRKQDLLEHLLDRSEVRSALVFTRTKQRAKRLAQRLDRKGYQVAEIQGNLSQSRRQQSLEGFKSGKYDVLVATDIAARGIDVTRVSHVINFDVPDTVDAYTHRIGRTGRAERTGDAVTLVTTEDLRQVRAIERTLSMRIQRVTVEGYGGEAVERCEAQPSKPRKSGASRRPKQAGQRSGGTSGGAKPARKPQHEDATPRTARPTNETASTSQRREADGRPNDTRQDHARGRNRRGPSRRGGRPNRAVPTES